MHGWVLYDDGHPLLAPLTDLRASFELRTGASTTLERWSHHFGSPPSALFVPEALRDLVASRHRMPVNTLPPGESFALVNGRQTRPGELPPSAIPRKDVERVVRASASPFDISDLKSQLLTRPWHLLEHAGENLPLDLSMMSYPDYKPLRPEIARGVVVEGENPVLVGAGVSVSAHVVFDTSRGSVALGAGVSIGSMCVVEGPCFIGHGTILCPQAHIRANTVIGPMCKVGGEVSACVFQGHSNKAHGGFLGDSYVGEWVNLGAGTITSNLKNTYGEVRVDGEPTGRKFLGSILGDHVKTAIGTRLLAGSVIGTGAMLGGSGFVPKRVEPFTFLTDAGVEKYKLEKFLAVARKVMARRDEELTEPMLARLEALHGVG